MYSPLAGKETVGLAKVAGYLCYLWSREYCTDKNAGKHLVVHFIDISIFSACYLALNILHIYVNAALSLHVA